MAKLNFKNLGLKKMGLSDKAIAAIKKEAKDGDNKYGLKKAGLDATQRAIVKAKILGTTPAKVSGATSGIGTGINAIAGFLNAGKKQGDALKAGAKPQKAKDVAEKAMGKVIEAVGTTINRSAPDYGTPVVVPGVNRATPVPFNGALPAPMGGSVLPPSSGGGGSGGGGSGGGGSGGGGSGGGGSGGGGRTIDDILKPYKRAPVPLRFNAFMPGQKEAIANQLSAGYDPSPQSFMDYLGKTHVSQSIPMFKEPVSTTAAKWDPKKHQVISGTGGGNILNRLLMGKKVG